VVTTIDADLQRRLEPLAAATAKSQGDGAEAAILVVEIKGRAVRAAVGSAGLEAAGGWIDMTRALRSPGSALKPFIYGFAFDDGIARRPTPSSTTAPAASPTISRRTSTASSTARSPRARR
jgi:penicillin-binding protein 1C